MELRSLELFIKLKQFPSLSQAAQNLYISQPALSTLVKNMEDELGCILLYRINDGIEFTPIGEAVYTKAKKILEHIEIIRSIPTDPLLNEGAHLAFATNFSRGSCFLAEMITRIQKDDMDAISEITFQKEALDQIIKLLSLGKLDFALVKVDFFDKKKIYQQFARLSLNYHRLYQEKLHMVVRTEHPLSQKQNMMFSDFKHYVCAVYENDFNLYLTQRLGKEFVLASDLILQDEISLWNYLTNTDCITVLSEQEIEIGRHVLGMKFQVLHWNYFDWSREIVFLTNQSAAAEVEQRYLHVLQEICVQESYSTKL